MRSFFNILSLAILLFLCSCCAYWAYLFTHREFRPEDCYHPIVHSPEFPLVFTDAERLEAQAATDQIFRYLGHGKQMTAYLSSDGKYVLKLFNPRKILKREAFFDAEKLIHFCSLKWLNSAHFKKEERLRRLFARYQIAAKELKEETGIVWVHLHPGTRLGKKAIIYDKGGSICFLNLDDAPFALQYKVELAAEKLSSALQNQDLQAQSSLLQAMIAFFSKRAAKGYTDRIQTFHNNYGFLEGRLIQIDPGRICYSSEVEQHPQEEMNRILNSFYCDWPQFIGKDL